MLRTLLLITFCLSLPSFASALERRAPSIIAPELRQYTLKNGMEVVVIPDRRAPVVTHMVWYKVGAADEDPGQSGLAHYLEHLLFKGTKAYPRGELDKQIAAIGGEHNAFTSQNETVYYQRIPQGELELVMQLEADRMLNVDLKEEDIVTERQVVLEERAGGLEASPGGRFAAAIANTLWMNHPYGTPIIGWRHEIESVSLANLRAFYEKHYTPNNAVLVVAGDVEASNVKEMAERIYGVLPRRSEPQERIRPLEPEPLAKRTLTLHDKQVTQDSLQITFQIPPATSETESESAALSILSDVLGGGSTSILHRDLVLNKKRALSVGAYFQDNSFDHGRFTLYAVPAEGVSVEDMEQDLFSAISDIVENGVTEERVTRAINSNMAGLIYAQDSQTTLARAFGRAVTHGFSATSVQTWPARLTAVRGKQLQRVAEKYLKETRSVIGFLKKPKDVNSASVKDENRT